VIDGCIHPFFIEDIGQFIGMSNVRCRLYEMHPVVDPRRTLAFREIIKHWLHTIMLYLLPNEIFERIQKETYENGDPVYFNSLEEGSPSPLKNVLDQGTSVRRCIYFWGTCSTALNCNSVLIIIFKYIVMKLILSK
jgi:hypothetical protein